MTNEALLNIVNKGIAESNNITDLTNTLLKLKAELTENIRLELLKGKGTKTSDITILKRILKCKKERENFGMAHKFEFMNKTYFGFLEGHYMIACDNNMGIKEATGEQLFNISQMLKGDLFINGYEIKINMDDLKLFTKIHKRSETKKHPYIIKHDKYVIGVDPYLLLDTLQFNNTNVILIDTNKYRFSPMVCKNDNKNTLGIICPVRLSEEEYNS